MIRSTLKRLSSNFCGREVFVGGLTEENTIHELVPYIPKPQRISFYNNVCFLRFNSQLEAAHAIQVLNGHIVKGQRIRARMASSVGFNNKPQT